MLAGQPIVIARDVVWWYTGRRTNFFNGLAMPILRGDKKTSEWSPFFWRPDFWRWCQLLDVVSINGRKRRTPRRISTSFLQDAWRHFKFWMRTSETGPGRQKLEGTIYVCLSDVKNLTSSLEWVIFEWWRKSVVLTRAGSTRTIDASPCREIQRSFNVLVFLTLW